MKKQFIGRSSLMRENKIKKRVLMFFEYISNAPRMLLEVFVRRDFGERYFNLSSAIGTFLFFSFIPLFWRASPAVFSHYTYDAIYMSWSEFLLTFWLYYVVLFAFACVCWVRYREIKRQPTIFDLGKYSKSHGKIHRIFLDFTINGQLLTVRQIEIFLEPAFFLIIGIVFKFINPAAGWLIILCAIIYGFGYSAIYWMGDQYIMDVIDGWIISNEVSDLKSDGRDNDGPSGGRGYDPRWKMPSDAGLRAEVIKQMKADMDIEITEAEEVE